MVVPGDNTVSGKHATVCVKKDEDSGSYVEVSDCSRLGTVVTKTNDFKTGRFIEDAVVAHDWWYILFGYRSPFQVRRINVSIHFNNERIDVVHFDRGHTDSECRRSADMLYGPGYRQ